jgi:Coenzyme PQQ synthesis protein D (PqqD)
MSQIYYPKRRSDVRVRVVDGEAVILDSDRGLIHQLNNTAYYIWEGCDGNSTVAEIAQQLAVVFSADPQTAADDAATLILQFQSLGLLESQDGGSRHTEPPVQGKEESS